MQTNLTVLTPADSYDLTVLDTVKSELNITDTSQDAALSVLITQASGECAAYCSRVFGRETVQETFRADAIERQRQEVQEKFILRRYPLESVTSVVIDGETLDPTLYESENDGSLYRLDSSGNEISWRFRKLVVVYVGGYELLGGLPSSIERATINLVKLMQSATSRDPLVKQESIPGVGEWQYWVGGIPGSVGNLPPDIQAMLDPYRWISV